MRRFRERLPLPLLLSTLLLAGLLVGCNGDDDDGDAGTPASLVTAGERVELNCFSFVFKNTFDQPVTDVHIPLEGEVVVATPPPGWAHTGGDGVTFVTPPPSGGTTTERPRPVPPGGVSDRFTFYLASGGPTEGGPIELSFAESPNQPVTDIWQGGEAVPVGPDGLKHITRAGGAYCQELVVTAPGGQEVKDLHLDRLGGGNPTGFIGVDPPAGWVSNPVDAGSVTLFTEGGGPGLGGGDSLRFKVYYTSPNARATWRMTDGDNRTIVEAEGRVDLF